MTISVGLLAAATAFVTTPPPGGYPRIVVPRIASNFLAPQQHAARHPSLTCSEAKADPFRPERPPLSPMIINAVQELLKPGGGGDDETLPDAVASRALEARAADPDYALTPDEASLLTQRVRQCHAARVPLLALLEAAVDATPWVRQFGATASIGVGDEKDPYVRSCRAECMLGALILHVDGGEVDFLDEERIEVLRDGATREAVDAVKEAVADVTGR